MKKQTVLQRDIQNETQKESLLNTDGIGFISRTSKRLKKYLYIGGLAGVGLLFNGCFPGYVGSEPVYVETTRSSSPSGAHVWVDGDWEWNRQSQTYVHQEGYWHKPYHGRKFIAGHWTSTSRGHSWIKGHWER